MTTAPDAPNRPRSALLVILFAVYAVGLVAVVILKLPYLMVSGDDGIRVVNLVPFGGSIDRQGRFAWEEIAYNTAVFIPLGVYLSAMTRWNATKRILVAAGVSVAFEMTQFAFGIGVSDITDVISNTAGAVIGIGVHVATRKALGAKAPRVVTVAALVLTIIAVVAFAYLWHRNNVFMGPPP
ncbi:MAG: VanZ family protein [Propionibacteriaceae bacterium]|jgi:glycopeptide antibiotics resistance protein|nr:VanZ family protein [Propionibacteriaceae bacterium]